MNYCIRCWTFAALVGLIACDFAMTALAQSVKRGPEARYEEVLKSSAGTFEEKSAACRELARVGTKSSVKVLARLLEDEKLSHMARYALETIPDPSVDEALRGALDTVHGRPLLGVIGSVGVRKDEKAVETLGKLLHSNDDAVVAAAAHALGNIGTPEASTALIRAINRKGSNNEIAEGLLRCADRFVALSRDSSEMAAYDLLALSIYTNLKSLPGLNQSVRIAAWRGAILAKKPIDARLIEACFRDTSENSSLKMKAAARAAMEVPGREVTRALCDVLPEVSQDKQILIIDTLGYRGDASAGPALLAMMKLDSAQVGLAAIRNVTRLGYAPALPKLAELAVGNQSELAAAARTCLSNFPGRNADATLQGMLAHNDARVRVLAAEMIGQRNSKGAAANLLKAAVDAEPQVRLAALKALREHASATELPVLLKILYATKESAETRAIESDLVSLCVHESYLVPKNVVIVKAEYGDLAAGILADVTAKVAALVKDGTLAIEASNANFGDPAGGHVKKMRVEYRVGDAIVSKSVNENETLTLTANSAPPAVADALCAAAKEAQGEAKAALFRVLRTAGGPNSLQTVHAATSDGDAQSRDAALHVLCDWPTPDALPLLVELVKSPPTPTIKILALRGVVRLIPLWTVPDATKYATLHEAIDSAAGNDEKRLVLSALAHVANLDALQLAETYLGDPALKEEACIAAVTIAEHLPPVRNDRVAFIMEKAARSTSSQELAARAKAVAGRK